VRNREVTRRGPYRWDRKAAAAGEYHLAAGTRRVFIGSLHAVLESLDLRPWLGRCIDWIVVGGETGAKDARYMQPDWARNLRDQCRDRGAAFFVKQMWKRQAVPGDLMVRTYPVL